MDVRETLVDIIQNSVGGCARHWAEIIADGLIAHGVTFKDVPDTNVGEWISVKDRLPEENTEVLIYCKTNSGKEVFFVDKIYYFRGLAIWDCWHGEVTHWMPLPSAPKGE